MLCRFQFKAKNRHSQMQAWVQLQLRHKTRMRPRSICVYIYIYACVYIGYSIVLQQQQRRLAEQRVKVERLPSLSSICAWRRSERTFCLCRQDQADKIIRCKARMGLFSARAFVTSANLFLRILQQRERGSTGKCFRPSDGTGGAGATFQRPCNCNISSSSALSAFPSMSHIDAKLASSSARSRDT